MNVSVEGLRLLETVSKRGVCVDASKVPAYLTEKRREHALRLLKEKAPLGQIQKVRYSLDATTGNIRSYPILNTLSYEVFVASEGHALVDVSVGVEVLCCLRDSGPSGNELADKVVVDRVRLWDYMAAELATDGEKEYIDDGMKPSRAFRQAIKRQSFGSLYGMRPSLKWEETEEEVAFQRGVQDRILTRWPGLFLEGGKETRQAAVRRRHLHGSCVWLEVACEAERLGCHVMGFWMNEPIIECPLGMSESALAQRLVDYTYNLLRRPV